MRAGSSSGGRPNGPGSMMKPFELSLDRSARLLRTTMRGFWDVKVVRQYEGALRPKLRELAALKPGTTFSLVDSIDFPVQSQAVAEALGPVMIERAGGLHPDRTAILVANALVRMQVSRHVVDDRVRVFLGEAEGMEWLLREAA
jgi:hypothetical protein